MAEPMTLEFKLTPDDIKSLLYSRGRRICGCVCVAVFLVLGAVCLAVHAPGGLGSLLIGAAAGGLVVLPWVPKLRQAGARRLIGTTKVEFSERGVVYNGAKVAQRIEWSSVALLADRPRVWVILTRPSSGFYLVPKSAVPDEQVEQFAGRLVDWSGKAYRLRKR